MIRTAFILGGPCGAGKTTAGRALAAALAAPFVDADDAHTAAARADIAQGRPLDDEYRSGWLDRVADAAAGAAAATVVVACSALARRHRDALREKLKQHGLASVRFAMLVPPTDVLTARLAAREGHFAGPALLPSQMATLEVGDPEAGVAVFRGGSVSVDELVAWFEKG